MRTLLTKKIWFRALQSRTADTGAESSPTPEELATLRFGRGAAASAVAACVASAGVACIRDAMPAELAATSAKAAMALLGQLRAAAEAQGLLADGGNGLFTKELVWRNKGRWDVTLDGAGAPFDAARAAAQGAWMPTCRRCLGADCALLHVGAVVSEPGAALQQMHRDGVALFGRPGLPAHCLTVFVPLCALTAENGPTTYYRSTHTTVGDRVAPEGEADEPAARAACAVDFAGVDAGAAIIFDYRILHFGGANTTRDPRPMLYFTYGRAWFKDATNYSSVSLL